MSVSKTGFPKVGQVAPLGAMSSKGVRGGPWGHNLNLTLDILELQMKWKKKDLGVFYGSLWVILLKGAICKKIWKPWSKTSVKIYSRVK